jgi:hypothetical protein
MFKNYSNAIKRWSVSPLNRRPTYKRHVTSPHSTELQNLASKRSITYDMEETPCLSQSKPSSMEKLLKMPTTLAEQISTHDFAGWRAGVLYFALWSSLVFLINLVATIWGSSLSRSNRGVFYEGDCDRTKGLNSGFHVLINILSTVLLSGSNYCMQVLSAPTRSEIDLAHASATGTWLDIGVPGIRNLKHISRHRLLLWCLLALSSLPLHLL